MGGREEGRKADGACCRASRPAGCIDEERGEALGRGGGKLREGKWPWHSFLEGGEGCGAERWQQGGGVRCRVCCHRCRRAPCVLCTPSCLRRDSEGREDVRARVGGAAPPATAERHVPALPCRYPVAARPPPSPHSKPTAVSPPPPPFYRATRALPRCVLPPPPCAARRHPRRVSAVPPLLLLPVAVSSCPSPADRVGVRRLGGLKGALCRNTARTLGRPRRFPPIPRRAPPPLASHAAA